MKTRIILFAALSTLCLVSCSKRVSEVSDGLQEMTLGMSIKETETKGYVTDGEFYDTPYEKLHTTASPTPRTMIVSAYLYSQSGEDGNYFRNEPFKMEFDNLWHHDPAYYWPMGAKLSFLAVSSQNSFGNINWCEWDNSEKVIINVDSSFSQDDIMFASSYKSEGGINTNLSFRHAQAWIQLQLKATAGNEGKYILRNVELENVYTGGELTVKNNMGDAIGVWSFRKAIARTTGMDDNYGVRNATITADVKYMDMLLPEQEKTTIVISYSLLSDPTKTLTKFYDLAHENWIAGRKYVYQVNFGE